MAIIETIKQTKWKQSHEKDILKMGHAPQIMVYHDDEILLFKI